MKSIGHRLGVAVTPLAAIGSIALAGDLDPPGGAVNGTMKTLVEVEPRTIIDAENTPGDADSVFKITSSGSYYLIGNITVLLAESAIEIAADDVTIDLNGFEIRGFDAGTLDGITASEPSPRNIHILNGTVQGFGDDGIDILNSVNCTIKDIRVSDCVDRAISVHGGTCVVTDCVVSGNGRGIVVDGPGVVSRCYASSNAAGGIFVGSGSAASDCAAYENVGIGIQCGSGSVVSHCAVWENSTGIFAGGTGCVIESNSSLDNDIHGIEVGQRSLVRGNTSNNNGPTASNVASGILTIGAHNRIENNHCAGNEIGVNIGGQGNVVIGNTCSSNTVANYDINPDNRYGPILDISAAGTAGVTGSAAAGTMNTADPWANFSH